MSRRLFLSGVTSMLVFLFPTTGSAGPLDVPGYDKAFTCSACHGFGGNSRSDVIPIIAGIDPGYFKKAIRDYATAKRPAPLMEPFAKMVMALGLDDVTTYFASQHRQPTSIAVDPGAVARGRAASTLCAACHTPGRKGDPARLIPDLAGQPPGYLREQMLRFKAGTRSPGDESLKSLKVLMKTIPDDTLDDLAAYYSRGK